MTRRPTIAPPARRTTGTPAMAIASASLVALTFAVVGCGGDDGGDDPSRIGRIDTPAQVDLDDGGVTPARAGDE